MAATMKKIGVVGAGQMGNGIAHVCALAGYSRAPPRCERGARARRARHDRRQPRAPGRPPVASAKRSENRRSARIQPALSLDAFGDVDLAIEVRHRERSGEAQDLRRALPARFARRLPRHQHLLHLHHPPRRADRPAGALHRHALHEPGAGHGAGGAGARHRHRRRDLRGGQDVRRRRSARRSRWRRISPPSSSTASCCR